MNKRIAIPVITVLAVGVSAGGYFVLQQSNKLRETESEIVALEQNVSALEENGSILEVKLTDLEAKVSTLEVALDKANDDVELQQKLVGQGMLYHGWPPPGGFPEEVETYWQAGTGFWITNPDCVSEITIDRIFMIKYDGEVIYDSVGDGWFEDEETWTEPMEPHEIRIIEMDTCMAYVGCFEDFVVCTVEIFWTWTDKKGLPLTGWARDVIAVRDADTEDLIEFTGMDVTQMVNMEQALDSEDKD